MRTPTDGISWSTPPRRSAAWSSATKRRSGTPAPPVTTPPVPVVTPLVPAEGDRRRARFETVACLRAESLPIKEAARRAGVAGNAVRRWLRAGEFVPCRRTPPTSLLDPHLLLVVQHWQLRLRTSAELHREVGARGPEGGYDAVRR
jgi:hypothetical protein